MSELHDDPIIKAIRFSDPAIINAIRSRDPILVERELAVQSESVLTRYPTFLFSETETPLMFAARNDYAESIPVLVRYGADLETLTTHRDRTPIYVASEVGSLEAIKVLIALDANKDVLAANNTSVLMAATSGDSPDCVAYLLEKGCDPSVKDSEGKTALDHAIDYGRQEIIGIFERFAENCLLDSMITGGHGWQVVTF